MALITLKPKSVAELSGEHFFIPSYQRGYRWDEVQVKALLNDLAEFENANTAGKFYCLQPLVVKPKTEGGLIVEFEVVDGQQRLTTLFLILHQLLGDHRPPPFQIRYARHDGLYDLLHSPGDPTAEQRFLSPDYSFLRKADKTVKEWLESHPSQRFPSLTSPDGRCAKFIWYELDSEAAPVFTRLNAGKIKLKDPELIRALFLRKDAAHETERQQIALRWDQMERRLHQPEFWGFLVEKRPKNEEPEDEETRIGRLFRWIAERKNWPVGERVMFDRIYQELSDPKSRSKFWAELEELFATLEAWFEDNRLYHLVGFLIHQGGSVPELLEQARKTLKTVFLQDLKREIRKKVLGEKVTKGGIEFYLRGLNYNDHDSVIRTVLLCFNLATLEPETNHASSVRFSFHVYRDVDWDLEHIRATAERPPDGVVQLKAALEAISEYWTNSDRNPGTLIDTVKKIPDALARGSQATLEALYQEFRNTMEGADDLGASNGLENLTLLDAGTNRGYGNSMFAVKRAWVLGLKHEANYVLPCTRNVFAKGYSAEPKNLLNWTKTDADHYLKGIAARLEIYFEGAWDNPEPKPKGDAAAEAGDGSIRSPLEKELPEQIISARPPELTGRRQTFLQFFKTYGRVEIPLLQRDYAQGRTSAEGVRDRFLNSLRDALITKETLNLDFVYGEGGYQSGFQPIDGQQRLTTLFLLHWFLSLPANPPAEFGKDMRDSNGDPRFRYSVRPSSNQFFNKLLEHAPAFDHAALRKEIEDQPWFLPNWQQDPTVDGALTMLEAIQTKFVQLPQVASFFGKLAESGCITMDVLNLGDADISDEIYIKMNARGKELTGFEKFKAWLVKKHEILKWQPESSHDGDWKELLDGDWLDLFWWFHHQAEHPSDSVSEVYFRTMVTLAVNYHAASGVKPAESWLNADADDKEAVWEELFTESCVKKVFSDLQHLSHHAQQGGQIKVIRDSLKAAGLPLFLEKELAHSFFEGSPVTYESRVWLQAICIVLRWENPAPALELVHWFRVIRNLLAQTDVDADNLANFITQMTTLGNSAANTGSVLQAVVELKGFKNEQFEEEQRKAALMRLPDNGSEWGTEIFKAEAHQILRGQIDLLLPMENDIHRFKQRSAVFFMLLYSGGHSLGEDEFLLVRAILSQSNPIKLIYNSRLSFKVNDKDWFKLLDRNTPWPAFRAAMLKLIDDLRDQVDLKASLKTKIALPETSEPWMLDLVKHGGKLLPLSEQKWIHIPEGKWPMLYHKTNYNARDVMLGSTAALRNLMLEKLLKQTGNHWKLNPDDPWRRIELLDGESGPAVYFTNHYIRITKKLGDSVVYCQFQYDRVLVSLDPNFQSIDVEVLYPTDEIAASFKVLLAQGSDNVSDLIRTALSELSESCTAREADALL